MVSSLDIHANSSSIFLDIFLAFIILGVLLKVYGAIHEWIRHWAFGRTSELHVSVQNAEDNIRRFFSLENIILLFNKMVTVVVQAVHQLSGSSNDVETPVALSGTGIDNNAT